MPGGRRGDRAAGRFGAEALEPHALLASYGIVALDSLVDDYSTATAINDSVQVVGSADINHQNWGYAWDDDTDYLKPFNPGAFAHDGIARAISANGNVVGQLDTVDGPDRPYYFS